MDPGLLKCLERGADWLRGAQFQSYYSDFLLFQYVFSSVLPDYLFPLSTLSLTRIYYS
jgi:hypothetical protein